MNSMQIRALEALQALSVDQILSMEPTPELQPLQEWLQQGQVGRIHCPKLAAFVARNAPIWYQNCVPDAWDRVTAEQIATVAVEQLPVNWAWTPEWLRHSEWFVEFALGVMVTQGDERSLRILQWGYPREVARARAEWGAPVVA